MTDAPAARSILRKLLLPVGLGATVGFLGATAFLRLTDGESGLNLPVSNEIAGLIGLLYVFISVAVLFGVLMPKAGARILNVEDAEELREQKKQLTWSAIGSATLGAALMTLALTGAELPVPPTIGAFVAAGLVLVGTFSSVAMNSHTDELQKSLSRDAITTAFYLMFYIGGGWSVLAHASLVLSPQPIDWLSLFACTILIGAFWQIGRRGMLLRGPN